MRRAACVLAPFALVALAACGAPAPPPPAIVLADVRPAPPTPDEVASWVEWGPMLGPSASRATTVLVQLDRAADVAVRVAPIDDGGEVDAFTTLPVRASVDDDFVAHVEVALLEPGVTYDYELVIDGAVVPATHRQQLQTTPLWQWRTDPPTFEVAFGSCLYVNQPEYDRPGDPYGGEHEILEAIAARQPDLMIWAGDNTYFREVDWTSPAGMNARWSYDRAIPELQGLLASVHHYATWDDHDFGPNDSDATFVFADVARDLFMRYWANPTYGDGDRGVYTRFEWGDAEFFLVDGRSWRGPDDGGEPDVPMLGAAQVDWLVDALTSSRATFKIVVSGSQMVNEMTPWEAWARHPDERADFFDRLAARGVEGVVILSGDRHHSELLTLERDDFYPVYEFTSSPLTAGAADARFELDNPQRVDGTLVVEQRSFGTVAFEGARDDRTMILRAHDVAGDVLWEHRIHESELTLATDDE